MHWESFCNQIVKVSEDSYRKYSLFLTSQNHVISIQIYSDWLNCCIQCGKTNCLPLDLVRTWCNFHQRFFADLNLSRYSTYWIWKPSVWDVRSLLVCAYHFLHVLKAWVTRHYVMEWGLVIFNNTCTVSKDKNTFGNPPEIMISHYY